MTPVRTMLTTAALAALVAGGAHAAPRPAPRATAADTRPNFLVIVVDDLGWSDLGAFGGEIDTPNLDALALGGVRFTGFHTDPTCSPTRSMLMSGVDNHQAGLGTMNELLTDATRGRPGYEGYLNDRVASIAELLRDGGYATLMAGKWHLGLTPDRDPAARGFEHSFALLQGVANHFGEDQGPAWVAAGLAPTYREDGRTVALPRGRFSADHYADRLIGFLDDAARAGDTRPFFAYLPFSTPHWPVQAPDEVIAKYKGRYDAGYDALRAARLAKQKALGVTPADAAPHAPDPALGKAWAELTPEQRAFEARKMEAYAGMVDRTDQDVGRVVAALKRLGKYENTVILFLSDNGPEAGAIDSPRFSSGASPEPALGIDNRLENIGRATSYVGYGPGWAQANSTPSWLVKSYPTEGGIRVSAFAAGKGVAGRRISSANLDVRDIAPTLLDYAGLKQPASYRGRPIVAHEGHSLRPILTASARAVRTPAEPVGYELFYRRALRKGDWKAVYLPLPGTGYARRGAGDGRWHLFDVARDPGETTDLAAARPAKLKELIADYDAYAARNGVVPMPPPPAAAAAVAAQ